LNDSAEIKQIYKEDIPHVIELLRSEGMNYGSVNLHQDFFHKVLVDDEIVGCVAVIPRRGFSEIKSLVVQKEHRSFSIFANISDFVTYKSLQQNNPCAVVKVNKHNAATILYRRRGFVPLTQEDYGDIYNQLRADCIACHNIIQSTCHPTYMIIDTRITHYDINEWKVKVGGA
jgi:N-acetylglutamate synthase-like GNAT family acetyltransferase